MAKEEFDSFLDSVRSDASLADAFAKAVADVARDNGFDVDEKDVLDHLAEEPVTRPLPGVEDDDVTATTLAVGEEDDISDEEPDHGRMTTMAMGEEGSPRPRPLPPASVTLAMGEEDRKAPPRSGVTTAAIGEEGGSRPPASVTLAIGEEDKKKSPPSSGVTTLAIGEEGKPVRGTGGIGEEKAPSRGTTEAVGEEDKPRDPPAHPITTMAVGEETRRRKTPKP